MRIMSFYLYYLKKNLYEREYTMYLRVLVYLINPLPHTFRVAWPIIDPGSFKKLPKLQANKQSEAKVIYS